MLKTYLTTILIILLVALVTPTFSADSGIEDEISKLKEKVEQLNKDNNDLKKTVRELDPDVIIKTYKDNESNLVTTADHAINKINMWIAIFSIGVTISIALGTILTYFVQTKRFEKLEDEIKDYKKNLEQTNKDLKIAKDEFEQAKSESQSSIEGIAATQDTNFKTTKIAMEEVRNEVKYMRNEVEYIHNKVKDSETKAKKSELKSKASEFINQALNSKDENEQILLYSKAIESDNTNPLAFLLRGISYGKRAKRHGKVEKIEMISDFEKAIKDQTKAIELYKYSNNKQYLSSAYDYRGFAYTELSKISKSEYYNNAINDLTEAIKLDKKSSEAYNSLAITYRYMGKYERAFDAIRISLNYGGANGFAYSTLAELYADNNNDEEFYKNIEIALQKGCEIRNFIEHDDTYNKYKGEPRFLELLKKYKVYDRD